MMQKQHLFLISFSLFETSWGSYSDIMLPINIQKKCSHTNKRVKAAPERRITWTSPLDIWGKGGESPFFVIFKCCFIFGGFLRKYEVDHRSVYKSWNYGSCWHVIFENQFCWLSLGYWDHSAEKPLRRKMFWGSMGEAPIVSHFENQVHGSHISLGTLKANYL